MKTMMKMLTTVAVVAAALSAQSAMAQDTATVSATANATVIAPIAIAQTRGLNLGKLVGKAGTFSLAAQDAVSKTDTAGLSPESNNTSVATGKFTVTGEADMTYAITVPTSVELAGTGDSKLTVTLSKDKDTGTLTSGTDVFYVGGSVTVAANQGVGAYSGTYIVSVNYN